MVPQSKVNSVVSSTKQESFKKGYEAAQKAFQEEQMAKQAEQQMMQQQQMQQMQQQSQGMPQQQQPMQQQGGVPGMSAPLVDPNVAAYVQQAMQEQRNAEMGHHLYQNYLNKLEAGKLKYPDFDEVVGPLKKDIEANPDTMGKLVLALNSMDNTADMLYELGNNPQKVSSLLTLSHTAPSVAMREVLKLSNSIEQNQQAIKAEKPVNEPLNQSKPSAIGADNGSYSSMSTKDFKKMSWLKSR